MEIKSLSIDMQQTFGKRLLLPRYKKLFEKINPEQIETDFMLIGIPASFEGNKLLAGISYYAFSIAKKLHLRLPAEFGIRKTPQNSIAQSWFNRDKKEHVFRHLGVQYGRNRVFSTVGRLAAHMRGEADTLGTSHIMNIPLHEILHCDLFDKIGKKYSYWHMKWDNVINKKFSKIDISPFEAEINDKIGTYGTTDALELHAVYWAKEICRALNSNFGLKYNPFETPKIKLSSLLREFIDKITQADYKGAVAVSKQAKKLQKSAQV